MNIKTITPHKIFYNLNQKNITSVLGPNDLITNKENAADYLDDYYVKGICKNWGIGELIALFEMIPATLLVKFINSPATKTNWLTSLGELLQVYLSRSKLFGDPKIDRTKFKKLPNEQQQVILEKAKEAKERREGIMSLIQVGAGLSGLGSFGIETFGAEKDIEDLSKTKRTILSLSSLASAIFMLSGYFEKNLIAGVASKLPGATENNMMRMNGNSDARCFVEWIAMTFLPWIPKKVKTAIDILIPLVAIKEGFSQIVKLGHITTIFTKKNIELPKRLVSLLKKIPFLVEKEEDASVPRLATNNFFLGKIRKSLFLPVLKFFKTNPPNCYIEKENLICEFASEVNISPVEHQNSKSRFFSIPIQEVPRTNLRATKKAVASL